MNVIHITTDGMCKRVRIPVAGAQSFDKVVRPMLGRVDAVPAPEYMTSSWNDADGDVGKCVVMVLDDAPKKIASNKNMLASKLLAASSGRAFFQLYGNVVMAARANGRYCSLSRRQLKMIEDALPSPTMN